MSGSYRVSDANNRIDNFKKPLERFATRPDVLRYKYEEVDNFSRDLADLIGGQHVSIADSYDVALVPINTSRPWNDQYYDNRLELLCENAAGIAGNVRFVNVMNSKERIQASHAGGPRDYDTLEGQP